MNGDDFNYQGGAGFVSGLLAGITVGIGVGVLLAPRSGADMRSRLASSAADLKHAATDAYRQTSDQVRDLVNRGTEAVSRQAEKVEDDVNRVIHAPGTSSGPWSVGQGGA